MVADDGQILITRGVTGDSSMPGSGATVTLWTSDSNNQTRNDTPHWKMIIVNIYSSHASAANGLQFDESNDGSTWRNLVSFSIAATTYTKNMVQVSAQYVRVRYVNSANVLTTWEMSIIGDQDERSM